MTPTVQMSIRKVIRAETPDDLAEAQRDVRLDFRDGAPRVEATVTDRRGHVCGEHSNDRGRSGGIGRRYDVQFDFTDPRAARRGAAALHHQQRRRDRQRHAGRLRRGQRQRLVEMHDVAGSGRAHTVNGR